MSEPNEQRETPKPSYPCKFCYSEYSWPAEDLAWCDKLKAWVCAECWSNEDHGEPGISLASELNTAHQREVEELKAKFEKLLASSHEAFETANRIGGRAVKDCVELRSALAEKERECEALKAELKDEQKIQDSFRDDMLKAQDERDSLRKQVEELTRALEVEISERDYLRQQLGGDFQPSETKPYRPHIGDAASM